MKLFLSSIIVLFSSVVPFFGQSTVQLFLEDFNGPNLYFQLNSGGVGSDLGNNKVLVNNVKGILHELEWVPMENSDGGWKTHGGSYSL